VAVTEIFNDADVQTHIVGRYRASSGLTMIKEVGMNTLAEASGSSNLVFVF
jgi:hypothetical protein